MADRIQLRRDSAAAWALANPVLSDGEVGFERESHKIKVGDGTTAWLDLPYIGVDASSIYFAGEALGGHTAVTLTASGSYIKADASNAAHALVAGVTVGAAADGGAVEVRSLGIIQHAGWAFTTGEPVFLGLAGALTQAVPVTAVFSKVLGIAVSPTTVFIDPQPAIFFQ